MKHGSTTLKSDHQDLLDTLSEYHHTSVNTWPRTTLIDWTYQVNDITLSDCLENSAWFKTSVMQQFTRWVTPGRRILNVITNTSLWLTENQENTHLAPLTHLHVNTELVNLLETPRNILVTELIWKQLLTMYWTLENTFGKKWYG